MKDITGQKFGRLTVIARVRLGDGKSRHSCLCECGNTKIILTSSLKSGRTKSCGCLRKEITQQTMTTHGGTNSRLYEIWCGMKTRCNNANSKSYKNYGERGVNICNEWREFEQFKRWAKNNGYADDLTIERVDNNKNYEPDNCTWIPFAKQATNTRNTVYYTLAGEKKSLRDWCIKFEIPLNRAHKRIYAGNQPFTIDEIYKAMKGLE